MLTHAMVLQVCCIDFFMFFTFDAFWEMGSGLTACLSSSFIQN